MSSFVELLSNMNKSADDAGAVDVAAPPRRLEPTQTRSFTELLNEMNGSTSTSANTTFTTSEPTTTTTTAAPETAAIAERQPIDFDFRSEIQGAAPASTTWRPMGEINPTAPTDETEYPFYSNYDEDDLGAEVKGYDLPPAPEMSTAEKLWAGNRKYTPRDKGIKNEYFQGLSTEDYAKVLEAGESLAEVEQQAEDAEAFYRSLSPEQRLALDHYKALPKGFAGRNAAAFATGAGRSVPLSHFIAPETAAERKLLSENPAGHVAGSVVGNVGSLLTTGGGVAKGIASIPKVGAAIMKSPVGKQAAIRGTTGALMGAGQTAGQADADAKAVVENAIIGSLGGLLSIAPEVVAPAGVWQAIAQPLVDAGFDLTTDALYRGKGIEGTVKSKEWLLNEA